jgi:hypothetical protein
MGMSVPIVAYGHACVISGGIDGSGSKAMSNGRALGSDGRWSIGSMANFEEGRMYPDVESVGARTNGRPLRMLLCAPILQIRLH